MSNSESSYSLGVTTAPVEQTAYPRIPIAAAIILLALRQRQLAATYEGGAVTG